MQTYYHLSLPLGLDSDPMLDTLLLIACLSQCGLCTDGCCVKCQSNYLS